VAGLAGSISPASPAGVTSQNTESVITGPSALPMRAVKVTSVTCGGAGKTTSAVTSPAPVTETAVPREVSPTVQNASTV